MADTDFADTDLERHKARPEINPDRERNDLTEEGKIGKSSATSLKDGAEHAGGSSPLFWQSSHPQDISWFVPPLKGNAEATESNRRLLEQYTSLMSDSPHRAWMLHWNYHTRAVAAAREMEEIEQHANATLNNRRRHSERETLRIDKAIETLEEQRAALDVSLSSSYREFADAAAQAGLNCDQMALPPPEPRRWMRRKEIAPSEPATFVNVIVPSLVEEALYQQVPELAHIAGEAGVSPVSEGNILSRVLTFFMQLLAPFVCGFMLALCLGTLVGILSIETLERADSAPQLILASALGFVIVYLVGEIFANAVGALARALEYRSELTDSVHQHPRLRGGLAIAAALICVALFFGAAEIMAEASGIRELHQQQISRQQRYTILQGGERPKSDDVPFMIYLAIGTLISGPYLFYKTTKSWGEHDAHLREAWLMHRQQSWVESKRREPEVQNVFRLAYQIEHQNSARDETIERLRALREERAEIQDVKLDEATERRFNNARSAAVGEAARLQHELETNVSEADRNGNEPLSHAVVSVPNRSNGMGMRSNGSSSRSIR